MTEITTEDRVQIRNWIVQSAFGLVVYGVLLFLAAGSLRWGWGWVMLAVIGAFLAAHPLILIPINPALLVERERGMLDKGVKRWDKWLTPLSALMMPLSWFIAGLDYRLGWSARMPLILPLVGLAANLLGFGLFLWAMRCNAFFAEGVRVQEERGHRVISDGPYRWVRHPGYAGAILAQFGMPFLLGSPWALIPSLFFAVGYILRTALEDRTLVRELPGYEEYTHKTRYRLLPWVW